MDLAANSCGNPLREDQAMSKLRLWIAMSLDGFVAGPGQDVDNPLGVGGMRLHDWVFPLAAWREVQGLEGGEVNESTPVIEESMVNIGATVMGRNMFGGGTGPWGDDPWNGWWGDNPPYHHPVFVLTHHRREQLVCDGGTTFTFVTDGIESALGQARRVAAGRDVSLAGGAEAARQYLDADLVDEMEINLVPIFLGDGERLFDGLGVGHPRFAHVRTVAAPGVTHLKFERT
jgi:dihydrofolate reductase